MLSKGVRFFVQFNVESERRILHPADVTDETEGVFTVAFEESIDPPEAGQDVMIFREMKRKFLKQTARIDAIIQSDDCPIVGLSPKGEPVPADSRECYRVSTISSGLTVRFGTENQCELYDVSATGFSVATPQRLNVGDEVEASVVYDAARYTGVACVQSVRELRDGRFRYGVVCVKESRVQSALQNGINKISMMAQRDHLKRLSRSG